MNGVLTKGVGLIAVLFLGWYLFTDPSGLATLASDLGSKTWELLTALFEAIARFIGAIGE